MTSMQMSRIYKSKQDFSNFRALYAIIELKPILSGFFHAQMSQWEDDTD